MLLVAVTGPVGSGKTSLLKQVAERLIARNQPVSGFLQIAGERPHPEQGAEWYDIVLIPSGEQIAFATRDESRSPKYQFAPLSFELDLAEPETVILDEFGPLEAAGEGHFRLWPKIVETDPSLVLMGVREDRIATIVKKLDLPFDLVVDVREPNALQRLEALAVDARDWEAIGIYGAAAGAVEATLGSVLHGARVPFRGQFLSTLQALVLTSAAEGLARRERVGWVAMVAAGLKALSPAGSRLRPMLAISTQGVLYAAAIKVFGWNRHAVFIGGLLIGAWASGQSLLLQWVLVGNQLFKAYDTVVHWIADFLNLGTPALPAVLGGVIAVSSLITGIVTLAFWNRRHRGLERLRTIRTNRKKHTQHVHPLWGAVREVFHPAFWLPILFILVILLATGTKWGEAAIIALRAMAVALVLFGIVRLIQVEKLASALQKRGLLGPAAAVSRAFRRR